MSTRFRRGLLASVLGAVLAIGSLAAQSGAPMVVLITIDGFAAYHLQNPAIDLPVIRDLASSGVLADSSETVFPSVTHPSHTTIVTGVSPRRHGVLNNRVVDRRTGERFHVTNRPHGEMVKAPTIFDAAHRKGLLTAAFFWPETKDDPAVSINFPEVFAADHVADAGAVPRALLQELRTAGVPIDDFFRYYEDPFLHGTCDYVLAQAAAHAIVTRRPALTAIHFLMTDVVQHLVGPAHYRSLAALSAADRAVGVLVDAVRKAHLEQEVTFIVAADHGFATVDRQMNVAPLFGDPALKDKIAMYPQGWTLSIELTPSFDRATDQPALDRALDAASKTAGIARVLRPEDFHALGLPTYDESPYVRGQYMLVADIDTHLVAQPGNRSSAKVPMAPEHEHGYLPTDPKMYPALVLSGRGIRKGARIGHVRNVDIAPTIARLLGLDLPDVEGQPLEAALQP